MKLSSFPYLIQKEVLDHLSINQLFFFSLCSKNTKNFIKQTQKYQLKNVERVTYTIRNAFKAIHVKMANEKSDSSVMYLRSKKDFEAFWRNDLVQEVRVKELPTPIDFLRCLTTDSDFDATYSPDTLESIIESIHHQLYDLLGNGTKFWLHSCDYDVEGGTHFLPLLHNIQKAEVFGAGFESSKIDEFLDRSTCLEYFSFGTFHEKPAIKLRENSKLYDLDSVYVSTMGCRSCPMANDVLKRFNGRHAFLRGREIDTSNVILFLNEWKSGEKFINLELISLDHYFDLHEIRNALEIKQINREVKYSFIRRFGEEDIDFPHLDSGEFKSSLYMVRESDDHVASLLLTEELIFMGVWNMTEKEFLESF